jgi:N-acetylmuramoyl-L-alanine amidase
MSSIANAEIGSGYWLGERSGTMAKYHTVKQGEHLSRIARQYGFTDYRTIWDHAENAALKQKRQDAHVLFPRDRLFIPDKQTKEVSGNTEQRHRFQVQQPALKLRLVLEHIYDAPLADAPGELQVESRPQPVTTDSDGQIERAIPIPAEHAQLRLKEPQSPPVDMAMSIKIGHLDPVEEVSGQKARLNNLGYFAGPIDGKADEENDALLRSAIEEFQCEHFPEPRRADGVPVEVDGICGPKTQQKLKQVHGC